jgi:hypothetical protein
MLPSALFVGSRCEPGAGWCSIQEGDAISLTVYGSRLTQWLAAVARTRRWVEGILGVAPISPFAGKLLKLHLLLIADPSPQAAAKATTRSLASSRDW